MVFWNSSLIVWISFQRIITSMYSHTTSYGNVAGSFELLTVTGLGICKIWRKPSVNREKTKQKILYLQYVAVLKQFIFAERTSDWFLHIEATKNMLNLFASSGHINYAKSARFYVQKMQKLCEEFPWLYQEFQDGFHAVRRSNTLRELIFAELIFAFFGPVCEIKFREIYKIWLDRENKFRKI